MALQLNSKPLLQTDPQLYILYAAMKRKGRNVLTGNTCTSKHYASPSDKMGPKDETSHLALKPFISGCITDAYYRYMMRVQPP